MTLVPFFLNSASDSGQSGMGCVGGRQEAGSLQNIDKTWLWVTTPTLVLFFLLWREIVKSEGFAVFYEAVVKQKFLAENTSSFGRKRIFPVQWCSKYFKNVAFVFKLCIRKSVPFGKAGRPTAVTSNISVSTSSRVWLSVVHLLILFLTYRCSCGVWSQYALV